jgi:hypothetical protein
MEGGEIELVTLFPADRLAQVVEREPAREVRRQLARALFGSLNLADGFAFGLEAAFHE